MTVATIRQSGNLIDISSDGKIPLPSHVYSRLESELQYVYVKQLYGEAKFETGKDLEFETRNLFRYDSKDRLLCGKGFKQTVIRALETCGYSIHLVRKDPEWLKKDRYKEYWDNVDSCFEYRPKQRECLKIISISECGVINAPTGFGKGQIINMLCHLYPKAKIDVVTVGKDLVQKTYRLLSKDLPNVGIVGMCKKQYGRVTVYSADSLHLSEGDADLLIVDEAHELMAPSYGANLAKYRYSRNFAFTATPTGRSDNADRKMESLFGPEIFSMSYQEAVELGLVVQIHVDWIDAFFDNPTPGFIGVKKKRFGIWRNDRRNNLIAQKLEKYLDDQVLILVEKIEHAVYLRQYLPSFALCYDEMKNSHRNRYIKEGLLEKREPKMTNLLREQMRIDFEDGRLKHVIATGVWATGVSFDALPVLVWAGGGRSEIKSTQVPGRVCRIHESSGKQIGVLIDCCDQFDTQFENQADMRCRFYKKHGWVQLYENGRRARKKKVDI